MAKISTFLLVAVCVLSGYRKELTKGGDETEARVLAKSLLPFLGYFDPAVDGLVTGPFFPLCPMPDVRIFDVGLRPYAELGYVSTKQNLRFNNSIAGLTGKYSVAQPAATSAVLVSGVVQYSADIAPTLVFVKRAGEGRFIGASRLQAKGSDNNEKIAYWQLQLAPQLVTGNSKLEVWVYDDRSQAFYLVK